MGMNFSAITDGTARIPSSVGDDVKPSFVESKSASTLTRPTAKTPEQDKAMWEGTVQSQLDMRTNLTVIQLITMLGQLRSSLYW
jgi:hypothetical protein